MQNNKIIIKKQNGIYYTPFDLAEYLVKPLINQKNSLLRKTTYLSIFDPAYGEGALLSVAKKICTAINLKCKLVGTDIMAPNEKLKDVHYFQLMKQDFMDFETDEKFDLILMNPPYIRYHRLSKKKRQKYKKKVSHLCKLSYFPDLWAFFLIKSITHLKENGSVGAILPWAFLQADYAHCVREWLLNKFRSIKVLMLGENYFDDAEQRVLLLWLNGYGNQTRSSKIGFSNTIMKHVNYSVINMNQWAEKKVICGEIDDINEIIQKYIFEFGFTKFKQWADVRIGVVTGANNFFIMTKVDAYSQGLNSKYLLPILTSGKEFMGLHFDGYIPSKFLFCYFNSNLTTRSKEYIKIGEEKRLHLRKHSLNRDPWYLVKIGKTPDAFFPYRASYVPYIAFNNLGIQSTNSIHRIYFKNLSESQKLWFQLSLLSVPGQLALEAFSKIYGNGVLKIEPGILHDAIVYVSEKKISKVIYDKISKMILSNDRISAMQLATQYIDKKLNIPPDLSKKATLLLNKLQQRRMQR